MYQHEQLRRSRSDRRKRRVAAKEGSSKTKLLRESSATFGLKAAPAAAVMALCAFVFIAYGNSLANGFVWDDNQQIVMNPAFRGNTSVSYWFSRDVWSSSPVIGGAHNYYRPLQMFAYRSIVQLWGFDARAFHAVSLGFHLLVVVLAFAFFWKLSGRLDLGFAAALLFGVHPIHTEAVDWISSLPDLGCTAFLLLAFLFFRPPKNTNRESDVAGVQSRNARIVSGILSCAMFAMALLWKETAIVFPLLVAAYVLCLGVEDSIARRIGSAAKAAIPYCSVLAGYLVLRFHVLGFLATRQRNWTLNGWQFTLSLLNLIVQYCTKLIAPFHLNAYYVFSPVNSLAEPRAIIGVLFLLLAIIGMGWGIRHTPLSAFAAIWTLVTLIPVLDVYAVGRNVFTERYLYLPSVGFCLLVVLVASRFGQRMPKRLRSVTGALLLLTVATLFPVKTFARNPVWKNNATLFARTLEASPNAPFVQNMVAETETGILSSNEIETHYLKAIALAEKESPADRVQMAMGYVGLSGIYADHADYDGALRMLDQARTADPDYPSLESKEGMILVQASRWPEAENILQRAAKSNPDDENVLDALGILEWQHNHKFNEAEQYFRRALRRHDAADDFNASLHSNLASVYGEEGRLSDAIAEFKIAVATQPNDPEYRTNLAQAYIYEGQTASARNELETALAISPGYDRARMILERLPSH